MNKKNLRLYIYKVTFSSYLNHILTCITFFVAISTIYRKCSFSLQNIIHSSGSVQDEMAHYLYVLQSITLNHLETRMMVPMDCYNQVSSDSMFKIPKLTKLLYSILN